jgi:hypothetical protein
MNKLTIGFLSTLLILSWEHGALASDAWNAPAFSVDAAVMLREAKAVTAGPDAVVLILLAENSFKFGADGREKRTRHLVVRIENKQGAEAWNTVEARWEPWHQSRPTIRARVITPDGRVHTLDPKAIAEAPVTQDSPEYFSDARTLEGPLPAVEAGAVIEEEVVVEDTAPACQGGDSKRINFAYGKAYPARKMRLVLDAPSSLPLYYISYNLSDMKPNRQEKNSRVRITFEAGPVTEIPDIEANLPHDVHITPRVPGKCLSPTQRAMEQKPAPGPRNRPGCRPDNERMFSRSLPSSCLTNASDLTTGVSAASAWIRHEVN